MAPTSGGQESSGPRGAPLRLRPRELLSALRSNDVEFVVIGGLALAAHGYVRATKDLDIVPDPSASNRSHLASALRAIEARVDLGDLRAAELGIAPDEEGLSYGGNWCLATRYGRLDVLQDVCGLRSWAQLRAGAIEVNGVLYAGYDELISMKVAAGRDEDLRDVGALEAARRSP